MPPPPLMHVNDSPPPVVQVLVSGDRAGTTRSVAGGKPRLLFKPSSPQSAPHRNLSNVSHSKIFQKFGLENPRNGISKIREKYRKNQFHQVIDRDPTTCIL